MFPAGSIIAFTTASGTGYGLLFLLLGADRSGLLPADPTLLVAGVAIGLALVAAGLLASLWHLGHPERAWRALSQWRSSWLSREGVLAIASFGPLAAFLGYRLAASDPSGTALSLLAALAMVLCIATVLSTAMIYASLRAVFAWHTRLVPLGFLLLAAMGGAVLLTLLSHAADGSALAAGIAALVLLPAALTAKIAYWRRAHREAGSSTPESATGLGGLGRVRQWEAPHSHDNYLLREMGYRVARKHAALLRPLAVLAMAVLPWGLILVSLLVPGAAAVACAALALASMSAGLAIERWLFFAEAKHAVTLYYHTAP